MNREEEKLCLKWNDFQDNAISAFGTLRGDREFADVTLVCEDGQQVQAHKVILASSSPFFLNLLKKNKHPHPLIYMRGLKAEDLVAMIDFFYFGEADVYQENLDSFFAVAQELQIKGLIESGADKDAKLISNAKEMTTEQVPPRKHSLRTTLAFVNFPQSPTERTVAVSGCSWSTDPPDLDDKIKSMMMFSANHAGGTHGRARICTVCGREGQMNDTKRHIEANHISGVSHTCNICGTTTKTLNAMRLHYRKHK